MEVWRCPGGRFSHVCAVRGGGRCRGCCLTRQGRPQAALHVTLDRAARPRAHVPLSTFGPAGVAFASQIRGVLRWLLRCLGAAGGGPRLACAFRNGSARAHPRFTPPRSPLTLPLHSPRRTRPPRYHNHPTHNMGRRDPRTVYNIVQFFQKYKTSFYEHVSRRFRIR